tara:strand:- start:384 stop:566 length:183 start_codon:yes stop_codon:yes gene_type:complete
MATNKQLSEQVKTLENRITQLTKTNSQLLDEVAVLKKNYTTLVGEITERFQAVQKRFRGE